VNHAPRAWGRAGTVLLAVVAPLLPAVASAQPAPPVAPTTLPVRQAQITRDANNMVKLTVGFRDAMDTVIENKLKSGFPSVVNMRAYVFNQTSSTPIALAAKSCSIRYDVWDEVYAIQITHAGATTTLPPVVNVQGVLRTCFEARELPLADTTVMPQGPLYYVATLIEVNPLSPAIQQQIQRWVTRPGGSNAITPGSSIVGSFVGLFVPRIDPADKKLAFRTQAFTTPPPPPPP
jgi:hypothetical protein